MKQTSEQENMRKGECKYCHAMRMVEALGDLNQEEIDKLATEQCDCNMAQNARNRAAALNNAREWAENTFEKKHDALETMLKAIEAVNTGKIDRLAMKIDKYSYTVRRNKDGEIQVKTIYTDTDVVEF